MVTKYNVLYNGKVAYDKGLKKVESTYRDDFSELLPIEPFSFYAQGTSDEKTKPIGQSDFERAEEKATKSIQKHSMLIDREEKNTQIDEAYLLLGKSRYYTKRFTPALESFEYIIKNYPSASLIYETVVWRAKSNIHTGNVDFGRKALKRLLTSSELPKKVRQQAEIGLVMAYEKTPDSILLSIEHLEQSLAAVNKGSVASRVAFVLGQLYRKKNMIAESDIAFDKVINTKRGLYRLKLQSKLEKINNHIEEYDTQEFLDQIDHLIFVRKNKPYLGKLLFEKGFVYEKADSVKLAIQFYTKSIEKSSEDVNQKIMAYEKMGDIFYRKKQYKFAKSYYDSLINVSANKKANTVVRIKRKSKSLEKIVKTQQMAFENDSLLKIASLSDEDATVFFKNHIEKLKEQEKNKRKKELQKLADQNKVAVGIGSGKWYFYNNKLRSEGRKAFVKLWNNTSKGNGNWYASSLNSQIKSNKAKRLTKDSVAISSSPKDLHSVDYYLNKINKTPVFLDSVTKARNLNYYELGNAYFSQLGESDLAVQKLKQLLQFNCSDDLKIGAYYRLYKIYKQAGDVVKANVYQQKLQQEYPTSSFTQLATNAVASKDFEEDENAYVACYETIYALYQLNSFKAALEEIEIAKIKYTNTPLAPKYDLLHAHIIAKLKGKETFYKLLKELKFRHPNTKEAEKAVLLLQNK